MVSREVHRVNGHCHSCTHKRLWAHQTRKSKGHCCCCAGSSIQASLCNNQVFIAISCPVQSYVCWKAANSLLLLCRLLGIDFSVSSSGELDSICYLQTQQSAKSFSFASQRKQQFEQAEKLQAAQQAHKLQRPNIKYENINQFSQKVELYRGR